jgi:hypothetical protein
MNVAIDLAVSNLQVLTASMSLPNVPLPSAISQATHALSSIQLNTAIISEWWPALNDIRVFFTVVSVVIPLVFIFAGLVFLNEKRVVLWYLCLLVGCMLVVAGAFGRIIVATTQLPLTSADCQMMMYIGAGIILACAVVYLIRRRCCREAGHPDSDEERYRDTEETDRQAAKSCDVLGSLQSFALFVVCAAVLLLMLGIFTDALQQRADAVGAKLSLGIAVVAGIVGLWNAVWFLMGLTACGRMRQIAFVEWVQTRFVFAFLLALTLAYIPIGSGIFLMFNCNSFSCGAGWRLPDDGSVVVFDATSFSGSYCQACAVSPGQVCPAGLQSAICGGETQERLEYAIEVQCNSVREFFWPAAFVCIVMFCIGVPVMFGFLVKNAARTIRDDFPVLEIEHEDLGDNKDHVLWLRKVTTTGCIVRFLFQPFQYEYRYVRIYQFFYKFLIVGTTSYVVRGSVASPQALSLGAAALINVVAFFLYIAYRPYVHWQLTWIAIAMTLLLCLSSVLMVLVVQGVGIPSAAVSALLFLDVVLPAAALVMGVYLDCARSSADEEARQKAEQRRLKERLQGSVADEAIEGDAEILAFAPQEPQRSQKLEAVEDRTTTGSPADSSSLAMENVGNQRKRAERLAELRSKAQEELRGELDAMEHKQSDVDRFVDRAVKAQMQKFLMTGGVLGFVALGLAVLGLIAEQSSSVLPPFPVPSTTATELASYGSWSAFTDSCCCLQYNNTASESNYLWVEKWVCGNGRIKERVRAITSGGAEVSGVGLRGLCNVAFEPGPNCSVAVSASGAVTLSCTNPGLYTPTQLTLW